MSTEDRALQCTVKLDTTTEQILTVFHQTFKDIYSLHKYPIGKY